MRERSPAFSATVSIVIVLIASVSASIPQAFLTRYSLRSALKFFPAVLFIARLTAFGREPTASASGSREKSGW